MKNGCLLVVGGFFLFIILVAIGVFNTDNNSSDLPQSSSPQAKPVTAPKPQITKNESSPAPVSIPPTAPAQKKYLGDGNLVEPTWENLVSGSAPLPPKVTCSQATVAEVWDGNQATGSVEIATNTELAPVAVQGEKLLVKMGELNVLVPASSTDVEQQAKEQIKYQLKVGSQLIRGITNVSVEAEPTALIRITTGDKAEAFLPEAIPAKFAALWGITDEEIDVAVKQYAATQQEKKAAAQRAIQEQEDALVVDIGKKPLRSPWDGSCYMVKEYHKQVLKDPDSVQYIAWGETKWTEVKGIKYWVITVRYRAKNSFGGYMISTDRAYFRNGTIANYEQLDQ
jgi:hypothetical protein